MSDELNESISAEELKSILDANSAKISALAIAEKATLEAKVAALQHQGIVQHVFLKYGLRMDDNIDDKTGVITRSVVKTAAEPVTGFVKTGESASDEVVEADE